MSQTIQPLIYIVDGNESYRKVINGCLNALKLSNVKEFENGEDCYSSSNLPADLIVLDYNLGDENWNGIEFMEEYLRQHNSTNFLFLSSNLGIEIAVESVKKGALDYILKSKIGLSRFAKKMDDFRSYHKKKRSDKISRQIILGAIITFSTLTAIMSIIYSRV